MSQAPTISVIIPNYNYGRFIAETIESVLRQTHPIGEIIVVDDGSTDDSIEVLKQFGDRIKVIRQINQGVGTARNTGAKKSGGEFIAFLDADDIWLPTKIEEQMKLFADEKITMVSCGLREFASQTGETVSFYLPEKAEWSAKIILLRQYSIVANGSGIIMRRAAFEKAGGFDQHREMHPAEDWEFCYRMALTGKVVCVLKPLVEYRNHGDNGHLKTKKMERAMLLSYGKIFADAAPEVASLKGKCYGDMHAILAGDYFQEGNYFLFLKHAIKGLKKNPMKITRYFGFPVRAARRFLKKTDCSAP